MERLLADASKLSGVDYNIDNLGDVYDAIHVIQEDLGLTGVAAEEASTTFSGSFGAMKAAAQNVLANLALGESIGPSLKTLGSTIKTFLIGNAMPMIGNIAKQIPTILSEAPGFIAKMAPEFIASAADIVTNLATGLVDNIPTFVAGLKNLFSSVWDGITSIDWSAAGQIAVDLLSAAWNGLKDIASTIWDTVVGIFTGEVEFPDLAGLAYTAWNTLITLASTIWEAVKGWFTTTFTWPNISNAAKLVWDKLTGVAETVWTSVKDWFTKTFTFPSLTKLAYDAWNGLITLASTIWDAFKGWFTTTFSFPSLSEKAKEVWNGLVDLAGEIWEAVKTKFRETFSFSSLTAKAQEAWGGLKTRAGSIWTTIKTTFGASNVSFSDLSETASTAWSTLSTAAGTVWDGVKEIFGSFDITWPDFGALAQGALDGLKTAAEGVWNWVKGLFSGNEDSEAVQSVKGSTTEMATALADAELQISAVDVSSITEANEFVKQTVLGWMRMFEGMKTWMVLPTPNTQNLQSTSQVIASWITTWKGQMKFTWTLPTPHGYLPSFSVTMREAGDGTTKTSYPVFSKSLQWFAKGGIFPKPAVIGVGDAPSPEAVVPLDRMWAQLGREFDEHSGPQVTQYFTVNGAQDPELWATSAARKLKRELRMA